MTKKENQMMDAELDMVVGGASTVLLWKHADGTYDAIVAKEGHNIEKAEKLLRSGEVGKVKADGLVITRTAKNIRDLNRYFEVLKKYNSGVEFKIRYLN